MVTPIAKLSYLPVCLIFCIVLAVFTGCGRTNQVSAASVPPTIPAPSVVGMWSGTQQGIVDVNNTPFQYTGEFTSNGTFTLTGNWQGRNGPAGQSMSGTYTQTGANLSLQATQNTATAAGQTINMSGFTLDGTISADGKQVNVSHGPVAQYIFNRN